MEMTFVDDVSARNFAISTARDVMAEAIKEGKLDLEEYVHVLIRGGEARFSVRFGDVVTVTGFSGQKGDDK